MDRAGRRRASAREAQMRAGATEFQPSGFLGSLIGAVGLLVIAGLVTWPRRRAV